MLKIVAVCVISLFSSMYVAAQSETNNRFRYIELKTNYGSFLYSDNKLGNAGLLDQSYGGISLKLGWTSSDPEGWASKYGYPSYGIGLYSGFLGNAKVYGNPNAIYGFIRFPITDSSRRNVFSIEPSLGLTYNLNPFNSVENPLNDAIGARMAVYFNLDVGFTYKWTREVDILYGVDFSHFSNGSTFTPNNGLNLYGINLGIRYHYNANQFKTNNDPYNNEELLPVRFKRPSKTTIERNREQMISVYLAGGVSQRDEDEGTNTLFGTFSAVFDYEFHFNEMHGVNAGVDFFYDNRLQQFDTSNRYHYGAHIGYDFKFYKLAVKFQLGTYLGDDKNKGAFFMRPALRYNFNKSVFAQVGLKTLAGGSADYIEYGIGFKPFKW